MTKQLKYYLLVVAVVAFCGCMYVCGLRFTQENYFGALFYFVIGATAGCLFWETWNGQVKP